MRSLGRRRQATVLIVEDDPACQRDLVGIVERAGCATIVTDRATDALELLATREVELVILDLELPDTSGLWVLAELRRRVMGPVLPVVAVCETANEASRLDALAAGAIDFLAKPIHPAELQCKCRTLVELRAGLEDAAERAASAATQVAFARIEQAVLQLPLCVFQGLLSESHLTIDWILGDPSPVMGLGAAELIHTQRWFDAVHPDDRAMVAQAEADMRAETRTSWHVRYRVKRPGGREAWVLNVAHFDRTQNLIAGAALDISAQHGLEEKLAQAQKLEALGRLAGGIAHDFNNILAVILSFGEFALDGLPHDDPRRADIVDILKATERGVGLARQLLTLARRQPTARKPTDLNESLVQLSRLLHRTVGGMVTLSIANSPRPAVVHIDPVQFDQLVLNLAVNARDAMPSGGRLRIALEQLREEPVGAPPMVRLTVADTGVGMDKDTQRHIFEPFFTTKDRGKGTGLGLSTCFAIIEDAGGSVRVDSSPGAGATFFVDLPLVDVPLVAPLSADIEAQPGDGATVLVVEDDVALRRGTARALESAGYGVHVATDYHEAVRRLTDLGSRLHVVLVDLVLPGGSGYDVAELAAKKAPRAAVILTSGFRDDSERARRYKHLPILWKPVPRTELLQAVARSIAGNRKPERSSTPPDSSPRAGPSVAPAGDVGAKPAKMASVVRGVRGALARLRSDCAQQETPLRRDRVLLVEPDASVGVILERILAREGFEVRLVPNLGSAGRALEDGDFDVLVSAIDLPAGDSLELGLGLSGGKTEIPVVVIGGADSAESAALAIRAQVSEYLPRFSSAGEVSRVVRTAVESDRLAQVRAKLLAARIGDEFLADMTKTSLLFDRALAKIRIEYQPIVRSGDGSTFGYEALLRTNEPALAEPRRVIAAAEVLGRVSELGRAVRASVAETLGEHRDRVELIFINVHPAELGPELAAASEPLVTLADRVVFEVSERAALQTGPKLDEDLRTIRAGGYHIAVDDLGEGYAGLASLVTLRPDIVKIDMSLVRNVHQARLKREIVGALVQMARRSGITVVAEGVESSDEREALVEAGCDLLQGYLFAKPGPPFPVAQRYPPLPTEKKH